LHSVAYRKIAARKNEISMRRRALNGFEAFLNGQGA